MALARFEILEDGIKQSKDFVGATGASVSIGIGYAAARGFRVRSPSQSVTTTSP